MQRTYHALELARRPGGVEQTVLGADLLRICHATLILLGKRRRLARGDQIERAHEQLTTDLPKTRSERPIGVFQSNRLSGSETYRPAVESRSEAHDRDAGALI